jgi:hypothetical protein
MKIYSPFAITISLFITSCNAIINSPSETPVSTKIIVPPTNSITYALESTNIKLAEFTDKKFVGEDENYSIYIINNSNENVNIGTSEIIVYDKKSNQIIKMNGLFTVILGGGTIVYDDRKGEYILLSIGSYVLRNAIVLSLMNKKQAVKDFCISSGRTEGLFWNKYIIINNCDTYPNRPWGSGEAPSVLSINLETGKEVMIEKSDLTHQYDIKLIEKNNLVYIETYVDNEEEWINIDNQKTTEINYNLLLLDNNN